MVASDDRNLDYQFYFLFRTYYYWQEAELKSEPFIGFGTLETTGIRIDADKRLFRRNATAQQPLAHWQTELQRAWHDICGKYQEAFKTRDPEGYCENALLGVALLIMDESLERHNEIVKLDLYDTHQQKRGETCFKYIPQAEQWLLSIHDSQETMRTPANLYAFVPHTDFRQVTNWTLCLDKELPYLLQIDPNTQKKVMTKPIFAVYGLAHGDAFAAMEQQQTWPVQFQKMFCGSGKENAHPAKKMALFNSIMAHLIIRDTVFNALDCLAQPTRKLLREETMRYAEQSDPELKATPESALQKQIRAMVALKANVDRVRGNLEKGIETLNINHDNLKWRLDHLEFEQKDWVIDYQGQAQKPPLLNSIQVKKDSLESHTTYIRGDLFSLEGSLARWQSFVTERGHSAMERLGHIGHFIIFLVALVEMGEIVEKHKSESDYFQTVIHWILEWLQKPDLYVIFLICMVVYFIVHYSYRGIRVVSYYYKQFFQKRRKKRG